MISSHSQMLRDADSAGSTLTLLSCVELDPLPSTPTLNYLIIASVRQQSFLMIPMPVSTGPGQRWWQTLSAILISSPSSLRPSRLKNSVAALTHSPAFSLNQGTGESAGCSHSDSMCFLVRLPHSWIQKCLKGDRAKTSFQRPFLIRHLS